MQVINYTKTEAKLMDAMEQMDVVDAHEHLSSEKVYLQQPVDLFSLFDQYTVYDLLSAGMGRATFDGLFDRSIPLDQRWKVFRPYWRSVRHGSYARSPILAAKMVYGFDGITDENYHELSERIQADHTAGIYERILVDRCRIRVALTCGGDDFIEPPIVALMRYRGLTELCRWQQVDAVAEKVDLRIDTLDDLLAAARKLVQQWMAMKVVGLKITSCFNLPVDRTAAEASFKRLKNGEQLVPDHRNYEPLRNLLLHHMIDLAGEFGLVVAVHAGIWNDFRVKDSKFMLSLAPAHPNVNFDLFHLGMPSIRDTIVIAKNYPNVFLNLCWCPILSQVQTAGAIDELLDLVPVNKISAFGADYQTGVYKVLGHLHMARECCAEAFGRRIDRGAMGFDEAVEILTAWFYDNPMRLYTKIKPEWMAQTT